MVDCPFMTDDQLALSCRNGSEEAWKELMQRYKSVLAQKAAQFSGAAAESDLVSDAIYSGLIPAVENFDPERGSFRLFALQCISNAMLHTVQRTRAAKRGAGELVQLDGEEQPSGYDPAHMAEIREELSAAQKAMDELLSHKEKQSLLLRLQGFSYAEIARLTASTAKAAERSVARAHAKLRDSFKGE